MRKLTPKQQAFVTAYLETGSKQRAIAIAGYRGDDDNLRTQLWRLMKQPHVRAALQEQTLEALESDGPLGRKVLRDLAETAESETVRLRAAEILLDRAVGPVPDRIDHLHLHRRGPDLTPDEIRARRDALRERLGLPSLPRLVGNSGGTGEASDENANQIMGGEGAVTGLHDLSGEKRA